MRGVESVFNLAGVVSHLERDRDRSWRSTCAARGTSSAAARTAGVRRLCTLRASPRWLSRRPGAAARRGLAVSRRSRGRTATASPSGSARRRCSSPPRATSRCSSSTRVRDRAGDVNGVSTFPWSSTCAACCGRRSRRSALRGCAGRRRRHRARGGRRTAGPALHPGHSGWQPSHRDFSAWSGGGRQARLTVHLPAGSCCRPRAPWTRLHLPLPVEPDELASRVTTGTSRRSTRSTSWACGRARCAIGRGHDRLSARARPQGR